MTLDSVVRNRVRAVAAGYLGCAVADAPDPAEEAVALRSGTAVVSLRLLDADPPTIRVYSPMVRGLASTPELLDELNSLNAALSFVRIFWRDDVVYVAYELLAATIDDHELAHACDTVAAVADYYDVKLQAAHGGQVTYN